MLRGMCSCARTVALVVAPGCLALLAACGDDLRTAPSDAAVPVDGPGSDPGTGTGTLQLVADIGGYAKRENATASADFVTTFEVRVTRDGVPVRTGEVTLTSRSGTHALASTGLGWSGQMNGYDEVYTLDVVSGADEVHGVRVDGPDIHFFTAPAMGTVVDAAGPVTLAWRRGDRADEALLAGDFHDYRATIDDTGAFTLPVGSLGATPGATATNWITLRRIDRVVPAGAVAGSEVTVLLYNGVHVVAQPAP